MQFRPARLYLETERRAQVRHVHLRSADAETYSLGRHFFDEPPALAGNLVRRNELKIGRSFDHHARAAVENDLRQTRFEPQPARLQWRSQPRRVTTLIPLDVHRTIQHRDGFTGCALAFAWLRQSRPPPSGGEQGNAGRECDDPTQLSFSAAPGRVNIGNIPRERNSTASQTCLACLLFRRNEKVRLRRQARVQFEPQDVLITRDGIAAQQLVQPPHLLVRSQTMTDRRHCLIEFARGKGQLHAIRSGLAASSMQL